MKHFIHRVHNEDGSMIIVVALLVLALMTVIGIVGSDSTITENFIIRNVALHKQNVSLADSAVREGLQRVMQQQYPGDTRDQLEESNAGNSGEVAPWLNPDDTWEDDGRDAAWYDLESSGRVLGANPDYGFGTPNYIEPELADASAVLNTRGDTDDELRMALVGWEAAISGGGTSLKATGPVRRAGRILAEYISADNGMVRLEIGLEHRF